MQAPSSFAGFRFPPDVILLAVPWYLRYSRSGNFALSANRAPQVTFVRFLMLRNAANQSISP